MHNGTRICLKDFAEAMGVSYKGLHARVVYRGQKPHQAAASMVERASRQAQAE